METTKLVVGVGLLIAAVAAMPTAAAHVNEPDNRTVLLCALGPRPGGESETECLDKLNEWCTGTMHGHTNEAECFAHHAGSP